MRTGQSRSGRFGRAGLSACLSAALLVAAAVPAEAQRRSGAQATGKEFERVASLASQAMQAGRLEEAVTHYRRAVQLRPKWDEGWWYLATLLYDRDEYAEAAKAFKTAASIRPQSGTVWAMLGLCEYRLGRYDDAQVHIGKGLSLGIGDSDELNRVVRFHDAVLALYDGEFEVAQQKLGHLSFKGVQHEQLILALGLSVLRMPMLPERVEPSYRDYAMIRQAGWAEHQAAKKNIQDAPREYERLATDYAKVPGVQYAYGRFLQTIRNEDGALQAFTREIENSPSHALARLQIAYIKLLRKEYEAGIPFAEEAVRLTPGLMIGHYLLGRLLLETGEVEKAVEELEIAKRMIPEEPKIYYSLARGYTKLGRQADAAQARRVFTELSQKAQEAARVGATRPESIEVRPEDAESGAQP